MNILDLTPKKLRRAASIKEKIQSLENELHRISGASTKSITVVAPKKKRKMSTAGRAKFAAAQKARWARVRGQKIEQSQPKKRKMSAAARRKISLAAKARWAKIKRAKKS